MNFYRVRLRYLFRNEHMIATVKARSLSDLTAECAARFPNTRITTVLSKRPVSQQVKVGK